MYKLVFLKERYSDNYKDDTEMLKDLPNPVILGYYQDGSVDIECHKEFITKDIAKHYINTQVSDDVFSLFENDELIMTENMEIK